MVVCSVSENLKPQAALVGFGEMDNLSLIFGTSTKTRKFSNLMKNPSVAIVFDDSEGITVQYEGTISLFENDEFSKYKEAYFRKSAVAKKYENYPNQTYLKVTPVWIRYTNYNTDPPQIFEIKL